MKNPRTTTDWRLSRQSVIIGAILLLILHTIFKRSPQKVSGGTTIYPQFKHLYNHDVFWELPTLSPPLGVLFFFHGCSHAAGDLFPQSESCPTCLGLPEEQRIRKLAVNQHTLALVAISSLQATHEGKGCWDSQQSATPGQDDLSSVAAIFVNLITKHEPQLQKLPIYALGVSSGGSLALLLPKVMQLAGICSQIMAIHPQELENILDATTLLQEKRQKQQQGEKQHFKYPPTIFMHMPRDARTASYIEQDVAVLQSANIPVEVAETASRPLTSKFLTHHSDGQISQTLADDIVSALQLHQLLDEKGFLVKDPRQSRREWVPAVEPVVKNSFSLEPDRSPLTALMNVAFAGHDIITSGLDSALKWLESGGQGDFVKWIDKEEKAEQVAE